MVDLLAGVRLGFGLFFYVAPHRFAREDASEFENGGTDLRRGVHGFRPLRSAERGIFNSAASRTASRREGRVAFRSMELSHAWVCPTAVATSRWERSASRRYSLKMSLFSPISIMNMGHVALS